MESDIFPLLTHKEILLNLGKKVRERRKYLKLSRKELSSKSGVSEPTIVRLETTGTGTLSVLIKLAIALGSIEGFEKLFSRPEAKTMDEFIKRHKAK